MLEEELEEFHLAQPFDFNLEMLEVEE